MYAVVNSGGKQYKVQQGQVLRVEKIPGDVGNPVTFDRVLMFSDGESISIGQPDLADIVVEGHIVEQGKSKKIIVFKYKRRKRYRRKKGHRQEFTAVRIDGIKSKAQKKSESKAEPEAKAKKPETEKAAPKKKLSKSAATEKDPSETTEAEAAKTKETEPEKDTN